MPSQKRTQFLPLLFSLTLLVFLTACDSSPSGIDPGASADSPELAVLAESNSGAGNGAFLGPDGLDLDNPHPEQACKVDVDWFRANPKRYLENPDLKFPEGTTLIFVVSSDAYASGNGAESYTGTIREGAGKVVYAQVDAGGSTTTALTSDPRHGSDFDGMLSGTKGPDVIIAPPRTENTILGRKGDDCLFGGSKQDRIQGNAGNDLLVGYGQNDRLFGEDGDDILFGGPSKAGIKPGRVDDDLLKGQDGNDHLFGGPGDDSVGGGRGNDKAYGNEGDDTVSGHRGNDEVYGNAGNDRVFGNPGVDVLQAGDGDDKLFLDADDVSAITKGNQTFKWINGGDGHDRAHTDDSGTGGVTLNMGKARLEGFWGETAMTASPPTGSLYLLSYEAAVEMTGWRVPSAMTASAAALVTTALVATRGKTSSTEDLGSTGWVAVRTKELVPTSSSSWVVISAWGSRKRSACFEMTRSFSTAPCGQS